LTVFTADKTNHKPLCRTSWLAVCRQAGSRGKVVT